MVKLGLNGIGMAWKNIIHPIALILGVWGGFPKPPQFLLNLTRFELFRWFLVFALIYQGGGEENIVSALGVTVGLYLINKIIELGNVRVMPAPVIPVITTVQAPIVNAKSDKIVTPHPSLKTAPISSTQPVAPMPIESKKEGFTYF